MTSGTTGRPVADPTLDPARGTTADYRVRFDECGADGTARAAAWLRWAQDLAWLDSERLGYPREWYAERGLMWLVRGISLELEAPVRSGERISLTTRIVGFRRVWARRRTEVRDASGAPIGLILTDWVMTDARGVPTRVPDEFPGRFAEPLPPFEPTRVEPADAPATAAALELRVRSAEVDPLGHANNAAYVEWVDEAAALVGASTVGGGDGISSAGPVRYRLEYLFPAAPGERLVARSWKLADGSVACRIDAAPEAGAPADGAEADGARGQRLRAVIERSTESQPAR